MLTAAISQPHTQVRAAADKVLFYGLLVLLAWLPLPLGSNRPWSLAIMQIAVLSLSLVWLVQYLRGRVGVSAVFLKAWPLLVPLALLLLWVSMQSWPLPLPLLELLSPNAFAVHSAANSYPSLSLNPQATREATTNTLCYLLIFCLTLLLVTNRKRLKQLLLVIVFSGLFQAAYGSLMTLTGLEYGFFYEKYTYLGVATGTFVNRNHLAGYLEMSLALGIGLMLGEMVTRSAINWRDSARRLLRSLLGTKIMIRLALAIMVIGLVLTHSRMGNSAFFSSLLICGLLYLIARRRVTRGSMIFFGSLLLVDLLIVGNFFGVEKVVDRLQGTTTTEQRVDVTRDSLAIVSDYPLAGIGAGSYYSVYPQYSSSGIRTYYDHAHNDYVEFAAEFGLVGFVLLGLIVVLALKSSLTALFKRRDKLMQGLAFASTMGILALMIHSSVDFNLQVPANAALFMVLLALAVMSEHFERGSK
ncbi:O-antigen ligase family protein [Pseudomaricurvus alcaniphilus]|uniref:O-antigen ligase family protein n=1 Tax=Pseudomaricurvus alcaniphilus TaxID=1166482 RepID=UPI00140D6189|nr:O-antigen ligase family protein [Pseudomaricurvus alcaniphilus]NHN39574.1 O-antigen ligase family protein [Pseudomaricurvus alcaniphilus]